MTFVADVAQFTPKTVETAEERQKLTFRVKAHIPPDLLRKHVRDVKTGLPGSGLRAARPTGRVARPSAGEASGVTSA